MNVPSVYSMLDQELIPLSRCFLVVGATPDLH